MNSKFQCEKCYNYIEHCWCNRHHTWKRYIPLEIEDLKAVMVKTPPKCPGDCLCEICIEEAAATSIGHLGVEPGESLTSHLSLKCECGSEAIGGQYHSHYCPRFQNGGNSNE